MEEIIITLPNFGGKIKREELAGALEALGGDYCAVWKSENQIVFTENENSPGIDDFFTPFGGDQCISYLEASGFVIEYK